MDFRRKPTSDHSKLDHRGTTERRRRDLVRKRRSWPLRVSRKPVIGRLWR